MNFKDLNDLIDCGNKEIRITEDIILENETSIAINTDNLVIDGNNHTIDAEGKIFHFENNSLNLTMKNIKFKNFKSPFLMSLLKNNKSISFIDCRFIDFDCEYGLIFIEPPHPKRGWGFLNFFSLNRLIKYFFRLIPVEPAV